MAKIAKPALGANLDAPQVIVIAGPNGAGKTTYAEALLEALKVEHFVNADRIAQGLSGLRPESVALSAGRIMLERLRQLADERQSFGPEVIFRRFSRSARNLFTLYIPLANTWKISENTQWAVPPQRIAGGAKEVLEIRDEIKWQLLQYIATNE